MIIVSFDKSLILCRIQNPVEHLRWTFFIETVNSFQRLTIFAKNPIVTVRLGSKYASVIINLISTSATQLYSKTTKTNEIFSEISRETQKQQVFIFRRSSFDCTQIQIHVKLVNQAFWLVPNVTNAQKRVPKYLQPWLRDSETIIFIYCKFYCR